MRQEKEEAIYEQPQVCASLPTQSESFGPSEARGDTIYSDGGTSNQYKRMKISHGSGRGEGVVSKSYIHEQTQAFSTDQTDVNTTDRREYFSKLDMTAGLHVADTMPRTESESSITLEGQETLLDIQCAFDISLMRLYIATMKYI